MWRRGKLPFLERTATSAKTENNFKTRCARSAIADVVEITFLTSDSSSLAVTYFCVVAGYIQSFVI